jgi:hypothetical protein
MSTENAVMIYAVLQLVTAVNYLVMAVATLSVVSLLGYWVALRRAKP